MDNQLESTEQPTPITPTELPSVTPQEENFFTSTLFIILMLIVFAPLGLILMWSSSTWSKGVKILVTLFFLLPFIFIGLFAVYFIYAVSMGARTNTIQQYNNYAPQPSVFYTTPAASSSAQ